MVDTQQRRWTVPLVIALTPLLLVACGRAEAPDSATAVTIDDDPATGVVEFWAGGGEGERLPEFLDQFEEENPDAEVRVTQIPSDEFDAKLTAAVAAGKVPDMVFLYSQTQASQLATGAFSPVPDGLVDEADFFPSSWEGTLVDGTPHALPWYAYAQVFYYRSDLAEQHSAPEPTSWDLLVEFGETLKASGVEYPIALDVGYDGYTAQQFGVFAAQNGGALINDDGTEWTINSPENVEALDFIGSIFAAGLASPDGPGFLDTVPNMVSGKSTAMFNGPWLPSRVDEAGGADWATAHMSAIAPPAGPHGSVSAIGGGSLAVLADAANPEAAWKLARWLVQPEVQSGWYEYFGNLPAVQEAWDLNEDIASDPFLIPVRDAISTGVSTPAVSSWAQVGQALGEQIERVARGSATAQEALDAAQEVAESIGTGTR